MRRVSGVSMRARATPCPPPVGPPSTFLRAHVCVCVCVCADGFSDLEAMQGSPDGADAFICFGGVMQRPAVASQADWFVRSYDELMAKLKRYKVRACSVPAPAGGAWGLHAWCWTRCRVPGRVVCVSRWCLMLEHRRYRGG